MINAKEEFLEHTKDKKVIAAVISFGDLEWDDEVSTYTLRKNYTDKDLETFIKGINKNYDCGYGGQELFGNIWYADGTWSERGEYDGSEWWEYKVMPPLPILGAS